MSQDEQDSRNHLATGALEALFADPPWTRNPSWRRSHDPRRARAWMNDMMSPALARGGASFMGGFLIGWAIRRTIKLAVIVAGLLLTLLAAVKMTGIVDLDWTAIEANISHSVAWAQGKAAGFKEVLTGYLPSAEQAGPERY